jgi:hypothetical protein
MSRFTLQAFAIEGLKISVQSTNAVLSWPSTNFETYMVQYRSNLNAGSSWLTLTDNFSAATGTNTTRFSHSPGGTNRTGFYRIVRDGAHLFGLTNGAILSGTMQFPIEFALGSTDVIVSVVFYDENNSPIIGASAQGTNNYWTLTWNTPMSFNGSYNLYAEIDFASNTPAVGIPVTVTVSNVISFPNYFSRIFGNWIWIYAETIPNAAYELDIYDENTNYLGSFYDYADSGGYISFLWDLTDGNGHTFDSTNFYGVFTVDTSSLSSIRPSVSTKSINPSSPNFQTSSLTRKTLGSKIKANGASPNAGSSSASANQLWVKEPAWAPNDNWVVAYGLFNGQSGESSQNDQYMIAGGVWECEPYKGVLGTLNDWGLNNNLSPGNNPSGGIVFTVSDQSSRNNLLSYLPGNYRNFYFFGHGNGSAIGSYNGFVLTRDQIAWALLNVPLSYQIQHAAEHPYRFAFIDACDTAVGNFCEAFAIPAITVSTNFFAAAGVESRAFVGFKSWKLNLNIFGWQGYSMMTSGFLEDWLGGLDVNTCVNRARNDAWGSGAHMDSSVWIYGASDLTHNIRTRP